jgi:hypothetical protein
VPKDSNWKKLLGRSGKTKVPVIVDGKAEVMTDTQAYRFGELTKTGSQRVPSDGGSPLEESVYSLSDAAFRLMLSDAELLQKAAAGSIRLYANVAGMTGRWRRVGADGEVAESSARTLPSGYLALMQRSSAELAASGGCVVQVFELPDIETPSTLNFDPETLQELSAWGDAKKFFCVSAPCRLGPGDVVLLAPLTLTTG